MPVNTPSFEFEKAKAWWSRVADCRGGRDAMIAAGEAYVPALSGEKGPGRDQAYNNYVGRGHFFNATSRTIEGLCGAIFQRDPSVDVPEALDVVIEDITPRGKTPLHVFVRRVFDCVVAKGRVGLMVDMPAEETIEPRPYALLFRPEDVINWRVRRIGADEVLDRVVIREYPLVQLEEDDPWVYGEGETYLVLSLEGEGELIEYVQTRYRRVETMDEQGTKREEWRPDPPVKPVRRGEPLRFIPFMFVGPRGVTPEISKPPLLDLVDVNVAHWKNSVDYEHGLHYTALPTPWVSGLGDEKADLCIGPSVVWQMKDANGRAGFLEFSGAGLQALERAMDAKKKEMATLGARLLEEQTGAQETATAVLLRRSGENATLADMAAATSAAVADMLRWMAWWIGTEAEPKDVELAFELNREFVSVRMTTGELRDLVFALQAEAITYPWFFYLLQRGGLTEPGKSVEDVVAELSAEGKGPGEPGEGEQKPSLKVVQKSPTEWVLVDEDGKEQGEPARSKNEAEAMKTRIEKPRAE